MKTQQHNAETHTKTGSEEKNLIETTIELPLPQISAGYAIARIEKADIQCNFIGVDKQDNIVMKVSYFEWQKEKFNEIILETLFAELGYNMILAVGGEVILNEYKEKALDILKNRSKN